MKKLTGSIVALVTPFHEDGSVDFARLRELCDWHIANGTDAILASAPRARRRPPRWRGISKHWNA